MKKPTIKTIRETDGFRIWLVEFNGVVRWAQSRKDAEKIVAKLIDNHS